MSLYEVLKSRGYSFRQHLEEEGWTRRKLTVVDLDDSQRSALEHGGVNSLKEIMDGQGILESKAYPYADFPLPKLIFQMPDVNENQWLCLSTLLTATRLSETAYRLYEPEPGLVRIETIHNNFQN